MPITTTPSGGPQGEFSTYTPIYSQTLSATTASITFSNIPTTFTDLVLVVNPIGASGTTFPWMRFNGLTSNIYSDTHVYGIPSGASSTRRTAQSRGYIAEQVQAETTRVSNIIVNIMNYSNSTTFKTYIARNSNAATSGTYVGVEAIVGLAQLTAPITSITVGIAAGGTDYNFASGSTFTLYGIKAAAPAPKATGGDLVYTDNTYWYHVFNNSGTFSVKTTISVDYLVVAGGGSGGSDTNGASGGGGAGGYRTSIGGSSLSLTLQDYAVVVGGGGGAPAIGTQLPGIRGSNSSFYTVNASGGGGGGLDRSGSQYLQTSGGSGGGAGGSSNPTGAAGNIGGYTPVEGYKGGNGQSNGGAGGGGSSAVGANNSGNEGGVGGAGTLNSISGTATYYAGGGGGAQYSVTNAGTGGANGGVGGGGKGGAAPANGGFNNTPAISGTSNTGGGGGGGGNRVDASGAKYPGGNGGSGVVIVRYPV